MRLFRWMSLAEFDAYQRGETLKNDKVFGNGSRGFCFFNIKDEDPIRCMDFLWGNVTPGVCAVFDTQEQLLKNDNSPYASTDGGLFETVMHTEYSTPSYDNKTFKLVNTLVFTETDEKAMLQRFKERCERELQALPHTSV